MTVKEAVAYVRDNYPKSDARWELTDWLHKLASGNMRRLYGECFGWHKDLPKDIDAATELTAENEAELKRRMAAL